jgi:hypothetical protein
VLKSGNLVNPSWAVAEAMGNVAGNLVGEWWRRRISGHSGCDEAFK